MQKVLTILIPVYNTEKYIKRCLDSILLNEVLDDIEVLTVSDGSKDNSVNIIKEYIKKYPNTLKLIEKENGGHGSTINKGIEVATGKYFKVLDSDDWFNSIDFVKFVKRLKNENADLVVTNYCQEHVYSQSEVIYKYKDLKDEKVYIFDKFDLNLLNYEYFVMATSTYKLDVLKNSELHLLEKTFYVDMQYNIEPIININTFVYYDLDIYRYYIGRKDQSVNTASFVKNQDHHERVMKHLIEYYTNYQNNYSEVKKKYVEMILLYMLYTHYTIYLSYDKNHKKSYKKIKKFDKWFKEKNTELYMKVNTYGIIKFYRKIKFIYINKYLKKILLILKKRSFMAGEF